MDALCSIFSGTGRYWVDVRINLPGDSDYDPSVPWISKIRENGDIAADVHPYVGLGLIKGKGGRGSH